MSIAVSTALHTTFDAAGSACARSTGAERSGHSARDPWEDHAENHSR